MNAVSNQDDRDAAQVLQFACDFCGKTFAWKPEYSGRTLKCTCGREFAVPETPDINSDGLYDIAGDDKPKPAAKPPVSPTPFKAGEGAVVPQVMRVEPIQYQHPKTPGSSELDRLFPDRVKDLWLPICLVAGGTIVEIIYTVISSRYSRYGLRGAMTSLGMNVIVFTAIMLVTILIAGKIRQINFGSFPVAVMKLCAVVLGTLGITHLIGPMFGLIPLVGGLFYGVISFAAYFALLGALFDLDESDTWYCTCIMFLVWLALYFAVPRLL